MQQKRQARSRAERRASGLSNEARKVARPSEASTAISGMQIMLAGSAKTVARWKYRAMGSTMTASAMRPISASWAAQRTAIIILAGSKWAHLPKMPASGSPAIRSVTRNCAKRGGIAVSRQSVAKIAGGARIGEEAAFAERHCDARYGDDSEEGHLEAGLEQSRGDQTRTASTAAPRALRELRWRERRRESRKTAVIRRARCTGTPKPVSSAYA